MPRFLKMAVRPLFLVLALMLAAMPVIQGGAAFAQGGWRTYKDSKYGYRVEFPGVPSLSQETTPAGASIDIAILQAGTTGMFAVVSTTSPKALDAASALDNGTEGALSADNGQLISKADLTVDGAPARDLVIRAPETGVTTRTRMVVQGSNFYQVMAVGQPETPLEGADRFINSFRLMAPPAPTTPTAPGTMAPVPDRQ